VTDGRDGRSRCEGFAGFEAGGLGVLAPPAKAVDGKGLAFAEQAQDQAHAEVHQALLEPVTTGEQGGDFTGRAVTMGGAYDPASPEGVPVAVVGAALQAAAGQER